MSDKGHLSNKSSAYYLHEIIGDKTETIILAHLSEENNKPEIAYKELEDTLKKTIITAEETKKEMMHQAERECEMIVTNAKHNASRIVNEALIEAEKATSYAKSLQKNIKALKSDIKSLIDKQQMVLDDIEVLEDD